MAGGQLRQLGVEGDAGTGHDVDVSVRTDLPRCLLGNAFGDLSRRADTDLGQAGDIVGSVGAEECPVDLPPAGVGSNQDDGGPLDTVGSELVEGSAATASRLETP